MNESGFNIKIAGGDEERVRIGPPSGHYMFFKTRRYGKLHFEKRVADSWRADPVVAEALRKEFEIGYGLDHPCIARYLAYDGDALYEEYIEGDTLRALLDRDDRRLHDSGFIGNLCRSLLEALDYIHEAGILHLDLKPENVMITRVGKGAKLIDFNCARSGSFDRTQGYTEFCMAPEQADGDTDGYTDIYLLGRLIEEVAVHTGTLRRWKSFIRKATAKDPAYRFSSDKEALRYLASRSQHGIRWSWIWILVPVTLLFFLPIASTMKIGSWERRCIRFPSRIVMSGILSLR